MTLQEMLSMGHHFVHSLKNKVVCAPLQSALHNESAKLAAKCGSVLLSGSLRHIQLGVGLPRGCEALVHATRTCSRTTSANRSQTKVLVKADINNPHNSIHRPAVLDVIMEKCSQIYPMIISVLS